MHSSEAIRLDTSQWAPFKKDENTIKSQWNSSLWNRKQIRIRIGSSGELSIQTVAQNTFARLASALLKFFSCGHIKSFGKKVVDFSQPGYLLPKLDVPISEQKQQAILDLQCGHLVLTLLPSQKRLHDLGTQLCNAVLDQEENAEVNEKVLSMHQEILDLQLPLIQDLQKGISPHELHIKLQAFEAQANLMCEQYPKLLLDFIEESRQKGQEKKLKQEEETVPHPTAEPTTPPVQEPVTSTPLEPVETEIPIVAMETELSLTPTETETPTLTISTEEPILSTEEPLPYSEEPTLTDPSISLPEDLPSVPNTPIKEQVSQPEIPISETPASIPSVTVPLTPKETYLNLLKFAEDHVADLKKRYQFTSANWLQEEINAVTEQSPELSDDAKTLKSAIEALEDALDSTEENTSPLNQLLALPLNSADEQPLKDLVIADIRQSIQKFTETFKAQENAIRELLKNTKDCPWHKSLNAFFEKTTLTVGTLAHSHDNFESWIPGVQAGKHLINAWTSNQDSMQTLETLDKNTLAQHHASVERSCSTALQFLENETLVTKNLKLLAEYQEVRAVIDTKIPQLKQEGQYLHVEHLESLHKQHAAIIQKLSSSLSSAAQASKYAAALEAASLALKKQLGEIETIGDIASLQQLTALSSLSSKYYEVLHQRLVENARTQLNAYIDLLKTYQNMLNTVIPVMQEQNNQLLDQVIAIRNKVTTKMAEATSLTTDYTVRLHLWQIFSQQVPLSQLPPNKLYAYLENVTKVVDQGLFEVNEDAALAGFKFD